MKRKNELRQIVLDVVLGKECVTYEPSQFGHLTAGVAEVLHRRSGLADASSPSMFQPEQKLTDEDWILVQEIFWDLVVERVITIGLDSSNSSFPWFRLHSEAQKKLKLH